MPVAWGDARWALWTRRRPAMARGATLVLRSRGLLAGLAAALLGLSAGAPQVVADFGTTRTISLYHIHTKETITITYKKDGKYLPEALKKLNWFLRDWRENKETEMDPKTIDLLWEMHTELGSKEPIHIICGYRSEKTNNMLRRSVGGQAKRSYHIRGQAIDAAFPDIPVKQMRYSALIRERGGVGYYPTSGIPFVHVDSGPVRAWPRLPRYELALLFPNGHTQHRPASGGPLTPKDVLVARAHHKELADQVASYFDIRNAPKAPVQVAQATEAAVPALKVPAPRPATRPEAHPGIQVASLSPTVRAPAPMPQAAPQFAQASAAPSASERSRLNELVSLASLTTADEPTYRPKPMDRSKLEALVAASLADHRASATEAKPARQAPAAEKRLAAREPQAPPSIEAVLDAASGWSTGWTPAPEFDDDHPEELSYRPFPITPFLTQTASADDTDLVRLVHPDIVGTLALLDDRQTVLPLRLHPGQQVTEMMWTRELQGDAVDVSGLEEAQRARNAPSSLASRAVRTTAR
jgi:uncharacterized protein YcbK (DUF882 family)